MKPLDRLTETTPHAMRPEILRFVESAGCTRPSYIPVLPEQDARSGSPLLNVYHAVRRHGGALRLGWLIRECPGLWFSAEFIGVLVTSGGLHVDVTPKEDGQRTVLFAQDAHYGADFRVSEWPFTVRRRCLASDFKCARTGNGGLANSIDTYLALMAEIDRTFVYTIEGRRCVAPDRLAVLSDLLDGSHRRVLRLLDSEREET